MPKKKLLPFLVAICSVLFLNGCREAGYSCSLSIHHTTLSPEKIRNAWYNRKKYEGPKVNSSAPNCFNYSRILKSIPSKKAQILECFNNKETNPQDLNYQLDLYFIDYSPDRAFNDPNVQNELKEIMGEIKNDIQKIGLIDVNQDCSAFKRPVM